MSLISLHTLLGRGSVGVTAQLKVLGGFITSPFTTLGDGPYSPVSSSSSRVCCFGGVGGSRGVSTSAVVLGKRNFRKFHMGNKRGTKLFRQRRNAGEFPDIPVETEVRDAGFKYGQRYHIVPELIPEFIVPDLTDCKLKPYVSYRAGQTYQEPFTPEDLFQHVYFNKLDKDHQEGLLDEHGNSKKPSPEEEMTPDDAWKMARMTGSDIFSERIPRHWECLEVDLVQWRKERQAKHGLEHFADFMKEPYSPEIMLKENNIYEEKDEEKTGDVSKPAAESSSTPTTPSAIKKKSAVGT